MKMTMVKSGLKGLNIIPNNKLWCQCLKHPNSVKHVSSIIISKVNQIYYAQWSLNGVFRVGGQKLIVIDLQQSLPGAPLHHSESGEFVRKEMSRVVQSLFGGHYTFPHVRGCALACIQRLLIPKRRERCSDYRAWTWQTYDNNYRPLHFHHLITRALEINTFGPCWIPSGQGMEHHYFTTWNPCEYPAARASPLGGQFVENTRGLPSLDFFLISAGENGRLVLFYSQAFVVQQQRDQIFAVPKPAVQHLSTCLELFPGVSKYRIWLMTLPEMGAGWEFDNFVHLPNF